MAAKLVERPAKGWEREHRIIIVLIVVIMVIIIIMAGTVIIIAIMVSLQLPSGYLGRKVSLGLSSLDRKAQAIWVAIK